MTLPDSLDGETDVVLSTEGSPPLGGGLLTARREPAGRLHQVRVGVGTSA